MEKAFIDERRKGLDAFLEKVAEIPYLYNSKEFQAFVRHTGVDLTKVILFGD